MAKRLTFEIAVEEFEKRGHLLLEDKYINARTKMRYVCGKQGEEHTISLTSLMSGQCCRKCGYEKMKKKFKLPYEVVVTEFEKRGLILLSETYENAFQKLSYTCTKHPGETFSIEYNSLQSGRKCPLCTKEVGYEGTRASYEKVKAAYENRGFTLLETKYQNKEIKMKTTCNKHPEKPFMMSYGSVRKGTSCPHCKEEKTKILSKRAETKNPRTSKAYRNWRKKVLNKDNYTCVYCNQKGGTLHAHHLDGFGWCFFKRYWVTNGVTLCADCHSDFHDKYGKINNELEQFEEWISNKTGNCIDKEDRGNDQKGVV